MDVVVDGLMVINSRLDPAAGSEELQIFSWIMLGFGGVKGCILSAIFLGQGNPYILFVVLALFGGSLGVTGLFIDKKLE